MRVLVLQHIACEHPGAFSEVMDERPGLARVGIVEKEGVARRLPAVVAVDRPPSGGQGGGPGVEVDGGGMLVRRVRGEGQDGPVSLGPPGGQDGVAASVQQGRWGAGLLETEGFNNGQAGESDKKAADPNRGESSPGHGQDESEGEGLQEVYDQDDSPAPPEGPEPLGSLRQPEKGALTLSGPIGEEEDSGQGEKGE